MEASKYNPDVRIYFGRGFENLLYARVRASNHDDETPRAANRYLDFAKFQRSSDLRDCWHKKNARRYLRR